MQFATRIADITDPELIRKILDHVNSRAPPRLPPRRAESNRPHPIDSSIAEISPTTDAPAQGVLQLPL
jgi:hypothetical protein